MFVVSTIEINERKMSASWRKRKNDRRSKGKKEGFLASFGMTDSR